MFLANQRSVSYGFIPDICGILRKYNLATIINSFVRDAYTLPTKFTWKSIVNNAVIISETSQWNNRMAVHNDFLFFRMLHPVIQPCILYNIYRESSCRYIMTILANIWCRVPYIEVGMCPYCAEETCEELIHFLSECILTRQLRENLIIDLRHLFGIAFETEFSALESYAWTLKLLGSPIAPFLESESEKRFLRLGYRYVVNCLNNL